MYIYIYSLLLVKALHEFPWHVGVVAQVCVARDATVVGIVKMIGTDINVPPRRLEEQTYIFKFTQDDWQ